jgi:hypothetical protein
MLQASEGGAMFAVALRVIVLLVATRGVMAADAGSRGYALELDEQFAAGVNDAHGGYPKLMAGSMTSFVVDPLELTFAKPVSAAFAGWVVSSVAQPSVKQGTIALLRVFEGHEIDRLVLNSPLLTELEIGSLGEQPAPLSFRAKLSYGTIAVLGGTKTASIPAASPDVYAARLLVEGVVISPVTIEGMAMQFAPAGARKSQPDCGRVNLTLRHKDIGWLYEWYRASVLEAASLKPATRRIDVQAVDPRNGKAIPLARLDDARIKSFQPIMNSTIGLGVEAELLCTRFTLAPDIFK